MNAPKDLMKELKRAIVLTGHYYGRQIPDEVVGMYVEDLSEEISPDEAVRAYRDWRRNRRNTRFPLPAEIVALARPQLDEADASRLIAAKIMAAVPMFGWNNAQEARNYIGELGWQVVQLQGGWQGFCENLKPSMVPTLQAQLRELAQAVSKENRVSGGNVFQIESRRGEHGLISAGEIFKHMGKKPEGGV